MCPSSAETPGAAPEGASHPGHGAAPSAAPSAAPATIRVGTSGYSFKDWTGPFYPHGTKPAAQLEYYVTRFDCLELNTTFYRIPDAAQIAGFERRTPPGFAFIVKLYADVTHKRASDAEADARFRDALQPLRDAGKMHGLLAQFPFAFRNNEDNRRFLAQLRRRFPDDELFVEFRRDEWATPAVFSFLRNAGLGWVCADEPALPGLLPPVAVATQDAAYVRLHGRNSATWYAAGRGESDRYDYSYSSGELQEWAEKTRQLARDARRTFVFFNNCHGGQAPVNAAAFQSLLGLALSAHP